jgi:hypothetical protein
MEQCIPGCTSSQIDISTSNEEAVEDWNDTQAAITVTLLPQLKFHDLVFGHNIGQGTFSTVKYCRHITHVVLFSDISIVFINSTTRVNLNHFGQNMRRKWSMPQRLLNLTISWQ